MSGKPFFFVLEAFLCVCWSTKERGMVEEGARWSWVIHLLVARNAALTLV